MCKNAWGWFIKCATLCKQSTVPAVQRLWQGKWSQLIYRLYLRGIQNALQCHRHSPIHMHTHTHWWVQYLTLQIDLPHSELLHILSPRVISFFYRHWFAFSRDFGTTSIPASPHREVASAPHQQLATPSATLAYGEGTEGRKRRSPSSYRGKGSKLSRPDALESLFGNGRNSGGILASGPDSQRQVNVIYRLFEILLYPTVSLCVVSCKSLDVSHLGQE